MIERFIPTPAWTSASVFTLVFLAASFSAQAQSARPTNALRAVQPMEGQALVCPPPKIEVELIVQPAPVHNRASVKTMTQYSKSSHPTVGLYRSNQRMSLNTRSMQSRDTQELCVQTVYATYAINHMIDVGNEYLPGTCAFQETLVHERTHERIHIQKAQEAQQHIVRELGRTPIYFSGVNYESDAKAWLNKATEWTKQVYSSYILPAQEAFDSPAEYERFSKACAHELRYHGYNGAGGR